MKIKNRIKEKFIYLLRKMHFFDDWPDDKYLKYVYKMRIGKELDLDNPKTFNEKLQWLKIHDRNPEYTKMVDKYEAKKYVANIIGEEYIIPTLGVWDKFDDINFDKLPESFVMKCTHNSGGVKIIKNKNQIDFRKMKKEFERKLKINYFYSGREYPYKNVKPRIIIEENLQKDGSDGQIYDYKLMCFNGKVKCSFVCSNRNSKTGLCVNFYDNNWEPLPFERHYPRNKNEIEKPKNFEKMIELAEKLSKNIPFVRVDFYEENNNIYFGELTFFPGGGVEEFTPDEWDLKIGNMLDLTCVKKREGK